MAALSSPNGHFIKASPVWPLCQEQPNCNFIKASPNGNFIKQVEWQVYQGQPKGHFVQAAPVAILSRQMAVSSKPIAALPKPMAILSKPAATAIYQGQPQYQLYDGCSGKGKPVGLALGGPSRYCADLIEAGPDCQFIKANSNRKGQPLDLVLEARPAIAPRKQFISSRLATVLIEAGPDGGQLQPEGPTLRSSPRRPDPLLRRISSLSTAGRPRF